MNEQQAERYAEIMRKLIEHENTLQNFRFTWFLGTQALLFAALGFAFDKSSFVVSVICAVGCVAAITSNRILRLSDHAAVALTKWWNDNLMHYSGPPRAGYVHHIKWAILFPSRVLPVVFFVCWIVLAIHGIAFHDPVRG